MEDNGHAMPCPPSYFCDVEPSKIGSGHKFPLQPIAGGGAQLSAADVQESSARIKNRQNIMKFRTSQAKLAKDPPAPRAKRGRNKDRIHSGKPGQAHKHQTIPRSKFSAESLKTTEENRKKVASPAPKQVWRVKEKAEPSKSQDTKVPPSIRENMRPSENAMKSLPEVQQSVKGKAERLKDSAKSPVQGSSSKSIHQGRRPRKNKYPAEATEKSGKQTSAAPKQVMPVKKKRLASNSALNSPSNVRKAREKMQPLDAGMARDMTEPSMETFKVGAVETISKLSSRMNPPEKAQQKVEHARAVKKTRNLSPPAPNQSFKAKGKRKPAKEKAKPAKENAKPANEKAKPSNVSSKSSAKPTKEKAKPSNAAPKSSSKPSPSRQRRRQRVKQAAGQEYSIEWHDKDNQDMVEEIGQECLFCEKDLIYSPLTSNEETTYEEAIYEEAESSKLPDAAVLPCGHAFHVLCLEGILSEDQMKDPLCFLCASLC